jgi:hypothetical protein
MRHTVFVTDTRTWTGVPASAFDCLRSISKASYGSVFEPSDSNTGTVTTTTPMGRVVLMFTFDPQSKELTYAVQEKPPMVPDFMIWDGMARILQRCQSMGDQ